jgi:hypothetical protein
VQHTLSCQCGESVTVEETAAGSTVPCRCGRMLVIPRLGELRRQAGIVRPSFSPALEIEAGLLAGTLLEGDKCLVCEAATDGLIYCLAECEKAPIENLGPSKWTLLVAFLTFGFLGSLAVSLASSKSEDAKVWGEDRTFTLPMRVCPKCQRELTDLEKLAATLRRVPVYRRLLAKYPDTVVSLVPAKNN